ncbi:LLM class flavin-dependent oxidoreductase [Streptomyces sp. FXJ1.172]|uniref:LLM class flavin-dependent oxidoreductase n=1 Tax=Streptomyces sp. FXJ1.172 TaxID=710705 RepID=UPI0007D0344C|nr:LLM class flavin-dependent oxidoreductase [Streptomyces sp. FXJ1.172]WEO98317.1 LLM class flavin-dependent oxidoreductase [Streptomyces sp. FXJ1.172]
MTVRRRQVHLAVRVPAADGTADADVSASSASSDSSGLSGFSGFERLARVAERGLFDFLLVDAGPEGRPEPIALLNALAGVTARVGLAAVEGTGGEPYELARRLATLDHLSGGRAGWPGSGWTADGVPDGSGPARCPQGRPVVIRTGEDEGALEAAAATADVIVVPHRSLAASRARYADVKRRLVAHGRAPQELKVMAGVRAGVRAGPGDAAGAVAAELHSYVREEAADGFLLLVPGAAELEEFVDRVVPLLQARGAFRRKYTGTTLRSHLGADVFGADI